MSRNEPLAAEELAREIYHGALEVTTRFIDIYRSDDGG